MLGPGFDGRSGNLNSVSSWGVLEEAVVKTGEGGQMSAGQGNKQADAYATIQSRYNIPISANEVQYALTDSNTHFESASEACE